MTSAIVGRVFISGGIFILGEWFFTQDRIVSGRWFMRAVGWFRCFLVRAGLAGPRLGAKISMSWFIVKIWASRFSCWIGSKTCWPHLSATCSCALHTPNALLSIYSGFPQVAQFPCLFRPCFFRSFPSKLTKVHSFLPGWFPTLWFWLCTLPLG